MELTVTVVKIDDVYSFDTKNLTSNDYYSKECIFVNGEQVSGTTISLKEPIEKIEIFKRVNVNSHVHNFNPNENENLTIEQYQYTLSQLEKKMSDSLEDEFEYRKFKRDYEIVQRNELVFKQKINFKVVDMTDPKIPYVTLKRHLGGNVTDCTAMFDQQSFLLNYIRSYLKSKGWSDKDDSGKNKRNTYSLYHYNDGMVNLYMEGTQLFDVRKFKHSDTLANVLKVKDDLENWIKDRLDTYFENLRENLTQNDLNKVLNNILQVAKKVDSKASTRNEYMRLLREIESNIKH